MGALFSGGKKLTFRAVAEMLGLLVTALGMIYISRVVGPEYIGFSATTSAVIILLGRLADGGLTAYASQLLARDDEPLPTLLTIITPPKFVAAIVLVLATVAVVAFAPLNEKLKYFLNATVLMVVLESCTPAWVFVALGRINASSVIRIAQSILYAAAIVIFIRQPDDWRHLPYLTLFNSGVNFVLSVVLLAHFRLNSLDRQLFDGNYLKRLGRFYREGGHFLKADLSGYVYTTSDRLILYYFTNPQTVGIYEAAYKLINPFYSINGVVTPTFFRELAQSFKNGDIGRVMTKYVFIMSIFSIPLGFYLFSFSSFIVHEVYGPPFAASADSLLILGFVITFGFTSGIIAQPFCAWNMQREFGSSVFWGNVMNTILNFTLIPFFGAVGAAIATLAAKVMVTVVSYGYFRRVTDYPIVADFGWFFLASLIPLAPVLLLAGMTDNGYLLTTVYGALYLAMIYIVYRRVFKERMRGAEASG